MDSTTKNNVPVWDLVVKDIIRRQRTIAKNGVVGNGRDAMVDLYHDLLDACAMARKEIEERLVYDPAKYQPSDKYRRLMSVYRQQAARVRRLQNEIASYKFRLEMYQQVVAITAATVIHHAATEHKPGVWEWVRLKVASLFGRKTRPCG